MSADQRSDPEISPLLKGHAQWPAAVLVLVGLVLSLGSFFMLRAAEFSRAQAEFTAETDRWRALIQEQLTYTVEGLRSVSAFLDSSEEVTRAEFKSFTSTILAAHPEIVSIEWIPRVGALERVQFEEQAHAEGLADYRVKDVGESGSFIDAPDRSEHYPIYYIEPFQASRELLGLDYAGRPLRSEGMHRARDTGELVAVTGFRMFEKPTEVDPLNTAMFLPRYSSESSPTTTDERRANNVGFVVAIVKISAVLENVFDQFAPVGISLEIQPPREPSGQPLPVQNPTELAAYGLQSKQTLSLPQLDFQLVARATSEFPERPNYAFAWAALGCGLALTALALGYLQSLRRHFGQRSELELERSRLFNLTPDLLCIGDFDGYFRQLSPAWERTLGYRRDELMSRPFWSFVHPDDIASTQDCLRHLASGGEVIDFENRYLRHDGAWRWFEWRAIAAPEQSLIYASARDVTEQRETNRALEQARRFSERVTEVMPSVLYIDDLVEHKNIFINQQGALSLGLPKDYFATSEVDAVRMLMHEEDVPKYLEHLEGLAALADGEISEATYRMRHADGSWRWFHGHDSVFERDSDGRVRLLIGTATDITAIKDAEMALRENNQRLDFILSAANMGVWELDLGLGTILCTDSLARLLDLTAQDAPRTFVDFLNLIDPEDREDERNRINQVAARGSLYQSEFRISGRRSEVRWMASVAKLVRDESGKPIRLLGLMRDITQRKQAESDRKRMEQRMRQSEKMEALGALAGGIAHDFNNILTAINGNARLTLHELPADHPVRINVEEIHRGAMRATDLVSRILAFSRNEEPALRELELGFVVDEAVRLLRATMPAMIEIRFQSSRTPPVLADATQIHQVIMNLGANARDAMSARGGVLSIGLREMPIDSCLLTHAPEISGETCVCLTVQDTGIGIPREDLDRIFEPFFTTKAPGHGTGMGLSMVHGIVRRHGGVILASSEPGSGAKFEIYFPTAARRTEALHTPSKIQVVRGQGERILYVDDEEPLVFLATRMLQRMGFQVEGFTDPSQALREFQRDPQRWDMVITDLGMPGMSGLDLAAELLRIRPDLPLMLTSGYVRIEDAERARMIGAEDIVLKPNTVEEMGPLIVSRLEATRGAG